MHTRIPTYIVVFLKRQLHIFAILPASYLMKFTNALVGVSI